MKIRALLLGLNYSQSENEVELSGCINDVLNMESYLSKRGISDITKITDDMDYDKLTWSNIILLLNRVCIESWKDNLDVFIFHYSGHGRQVKDLDGDEEDGYDEGIVPVDYNKYGTITDDVLNEIFTSFNPMTRIVCIFDCCHSGTILDLPYNWNHGKAPESACKLYKSLPNIICLSACQDSQIAREFHEKKDTGAFTTSLIEELEKNKNLHELHEGLNKKLKSLDQRASLSSTFFLEPYFSLQDFVKFMDD